MKRGALSFLMWVGPLRPDFVAVFDCPGAKASATSDWLLRHTADFSPAIFSIVRPVRADTASPFFEIAFAAPPVFLTNHFGFPSSDSVRVSVHSPFSFLPERKTVIEPFQ